MALTAAPLRTVLARPPRLLIALAAFPLAGLFRYADPAVSVLFPPCAVYALTGWYCSGCGTARALHALAHGQVGAALQFNALAVMILPLALLALIDVRLDPFARFGRRAVWLLLAAIVAFGLARNIPAYPFVLLAPR